MYTNEMLESMKKVEAARAENAAFEPRRMTAEEKDSLLKTYHPDYKEGEFAVLQIGPNKGEKVPTELAALLQGKSRVNPADIDLENPDYDTDVLIIGGGGAGASAAIEADNAGAKAMIVTKLRLGRRQAQRLPRHPLSGRLRRRPLCREARAALPAGHGGSRGHPVAQRPGRGVRQG